MANNSRKILKKISPSTWEHPADKAALSAIRRNPALNDILKKMLGSINDKSLRLLALSSHVRVGPTQFPELYRMHREACTVLDSPYVPELYVSNNPHLNARTTGIEKPLIVLNSAMLEWMTPEETLYVIAHELGHCLSGHALYNTLIWVLERLRVFLLSLPLAMVAVEVIKGALADWARKSEYSADRAGLLVVQDPELVYRLQMKMAGGPRVEQMDINQFFIQAADYDQGGDILDSMQKLINLLNSTHPFMVLRLTEMKTWVDKGAYQRILDGDYRKQGEDEQDFEQTFREAADQFKEDLSRSRDPLHNVVNDFMNNINDSARQVSKFFDDFFKNNPQ